MLAILEAFDEIDTDPIERGLSILLVITLLSTALPPILRRLQRRPAPSPTTAFGPPSPLVRLRGALARDGSGEPRLGGEAATPPARPLR